MAVSDKQLQANRRNAKLSTGPRTDDGKARSSMNGFKHPWLGVSTIMTEEDKLAMKEFVSAYIEDLAPQGAVEIQLAHTLAMDNWRLNRIKGVEENIFAWGYEMDPGMKCHAEVVQVENCLTHVTSYIQYADEINRISLYESRLNRIIVRNTELLNKRQADRPNRVKQPESAPIAEPIARTATAAMVSVSHRSGLRSGSLIPSESHAKTDASGQKNQTLKPENGFARSNAPEPDGSGLRSGSLIPTTSEVQKEASGQDDVPIAA